MGLFLAKAGAGARGDLLKQASSREAKVDVPFDAKRRSDSVRADSRTASLAP